MGTGASKNSDSSHGGQLYVSLKMENLNVRGDLIPHVYGSLPITGSWEPTESLSMARESASMWVLSFIVPPNHETLDFKFLLKSKYNARPCMVEEGPSRQFIGGALQEGDARPALFNVGLDEEEVLEYRVFIEVDIVSPFDLAASWRAYLENLQPSRVRGIPDVSINVAPETGMENSSGSTLELDLEHYVVPAPSSIAGALYAANLAETPRSLLGTGDFSKIDASTGGSYGTSKAGDCSNSCKDMDAVVSDPCKLLSVPGFDSKSVGTFSPVPKQESQKGLFVDRGVGSPRLIKSAGACIFTFDRKLDCETKKGMPAAAGAVAAAAIADQMLGPKEDSRLAIVLVGLPARGKTFTAAKLTRYLRWLGHETKHFNVGKYRRLKLGTNQTADFFRGDNPEGMEARNEVAALAMDDMISWMQEGGQVGIFDATNSTRSRRNMLMKMAEGKCKIIFLETICNDAHVIERNIRLKIQQSPDYAEEPDFEAGMQDFKERLANYEKVYEPVEEGSYIKMIDMASGQGGQIQVNNIGGYLPGRIVFFLVNTHLTPRPILLTRHGESCDNVRGRIGGDAVLSNANLELSINNDNPPRHKSFLNLITLVALRKSSRILHLPDRTDSALISQLQECFLALSEAGELYSKKLAEFIEKRLKSERTASIWTSTLQRTILTASPIVGFPKIQWRALEEINAGVCDGMTYAEIKKNMPEEYESRKKDKLRYRYPRGESYLDVIQRLEPVLIELERQRAPVVIISHQAVLRALYAYFADRPLQEIPHIEVPLHTIIEIQMGVTGVQEKRYKLMD
ncbi:6-phosphofructo-2-kinase/fructose-2,6-bisphosphatase-like isoform X1 [Zingiber officinale]|uniref:6-phosphofructo-2-kinase/fructose-2, 6-bisphosphatase-like isoform X1 n=1 Tax=Zingiber officinale TaxID=94328 RepID=UPI001C4AC5BD|nr:6-phosphofructo-2-kinase/fructose-2,6-bisphosphatase-like isoform X1 [Zingiber officinale]